MPHYCTGMGRIAGTFTPRLCPTESGTPSLTLSSGDAQPVRQTFERRDLQILLPGTAD